MKLNNNISMGTLLSLIGKKVRCLENISVGFTQDSIQAGKIYTVINAYKSLLDMPCIALKGNERYGFSVEHFELLDDKIHSSGGNV